VARFSLPHKFLKDMATRVNFKAIEDFLNDTLIVNTKAVVKVPANLPPVNDYAGTAISAARDEAVSTANSYTDGKRFVFWQPTAPASEGRTEGDTWFDTDADNKPYKWAVGTGWVESPLGNAAIGNLDAGKITAGTLTGRTVQTAASGKRVLLANGSGAESSGEVHFFDETGYDIGMIHGTGNHLEVDLNGGSFLISESGGLSTPSFSHGEGETFSEVPYNTYGHVRAGTYLHAAGLGEVGGLRLQDANGVIYALYVGTNGKLYIKPAGGTAVIVGTQS